MKQFCCWALYVSWMLMMSILSYRLFVMYWSEAGELRMLQKKQAQMLQGDALDSAWVIANRSCDSSDSIGKLNDVGIKYNSFNLISVQPQAKVLCENYTLADEKSELECYPLSMVWTSTFQDGVAFMKAYQASCMFLFQRIKINMINYPLTQWEISGWTVQESEG